MDFMNRAIKSVHRRPIKSLTLLILVFILSTIIVGAISVERAIYHTESNLSNQMRPLITFEMDNTSLTHSDGSIRSAEPITAEIARQIAELPQVRQHHYMIGAHLQTHQLSNYFSDGQQRFDDDFPSQFTLQGGSSEKPIQFFEKVLNLVDGDFFTQESLARTNGYIPIIISREVAQINDLSIGSTIPLTINIFPPQPDQLGIGASINNRQLNPENIFATEIFKLEVIGLFEFPTEVEFESLTFLEQIRTTRIKDGLLNTIFMPNISAQRIQNFQMSNFLMAWENELAETGQTIEEIFGHNFLETSFESVMELYDPREIEAFKELAYHILPDDWIITDLSNAFGAISSSMDSLLEIGHLILLVSIGATTLTLSLSITLYLHDRRNEIGIYSALGEKKIKIVAQTLIETMVNALIGMILALFAGSFISEQISHQMLTNELTSESNANFSIENTTLDRFGFNQEISTEEMIAFFETNLELETTIQFFIIGLTVIASSTIIPIFYIASLNPKKILLKE